MTLAISVPEKDVFDYWIMKSLVAEEMSDWINQMRDECKDLIEVQDMASSLQEAHSAWVDILSEGISKSKLIEPRHCSPSVISCN